MVSVSRDFYLRKKADGTIAFRIKVPLQLRQAVGRNELQMNIPNGDNQELALGLARCCRDHFKSLSKVEPMVDAFNQLEVRRIVRAHMQDIVEQWRAGKPLDTDDKWYCEQETIEEHIGRLQEGIGRRQFLRFAGRDSERLFGRADAGLARELMLAEIAAFKQILGEMEAGPYESVLDSVESIDSKPAAEPISPMQAAPPPTPVPPPTPWIASVPPDTLQQSWNPASVAEATSPQQVPTQPVPAQQGITLRDALEQFVDHKLTTGKWTDSTVKDMNGRMNGMAAFFGEDTPVNSVSLDAGKLYVKRLQAMKQGFIGRPNAQAVIRGDKEDQTDRPLLDPSSVREYLMLARAMFSFCEASGWLQGSAGNPSGIHPIPSMLIPVKKKGAKHNKKAFTPDQVDALLNCKELAVWANTPSKRWLFPILAYTGARIEEICKLRRRDIREQDGVPVIDINEDMGRNKNEHSTRLVPIHEKLLAMGLVKFAESRPTPDSMLFSDLDAYRGKWSAQILKNTNYFLHNGLGYGKGYSNHSLRHFANNELIKRGVRISVADQLLGRVQQGVGGQVYFKGHFMESLREAINQIP
jgi:integrase